MKLPELYNPFLVADKNRDHFLITSTIICAVLVFLTVVLLLALKPSVLFGVVSVVAITRVLYAILKESKCQVYLKKYPVLLTPE